MCVLNAIISMILSGAIPKMAFPRTRHGIRFRIPGDVRNAKFSRQKKAFSSLSMNNSLFFILSRVTMGRSAGREPVLLFSRTFSSVSPKNTHNFLPFCQYKPKYPHLSWRATKGVPGHDLMKKQAKVRASGKRAHILGVDFWRYKGLFWQFGLFLSTSLYVENRGVLRGLLGSFPGNGGLSGLGFGVGQMMCSALFFITLVFRITPIYRRVGNYNKEKR
jgi:hypothetical protein